LLELREDVLQAIDKRVDVYIEKNYALLEELCTHLLLEDEQ
tara:strand:- start:172 stop:294 length:123 start_codon:yes stop_codon:yes gene_type:complete